MAKKTVIDMTDMKIPNHVAIILDGNGRWATEKGLTRTEGHKKGAENFKNKAGKDYAASRGEYLNGIIMAQYLGYEFIDAAEVILFNEDGIFDLAYENVKKSL